MKQETFLIDDIPAILLGEPSDKVYLFVHGMGGNKNEAIAFAKVANLKGWQVLGIDLQKHKDSEEDRIALLPCNALPKMSKVKNYLKRNWKHISIRANSIGAWFSMLSFSKEAFEKYLFVSPILDMEKLITDMMKWANVTEEALEREKEIKTNFGQTLSWEYLNFAKENSIKKLNCHTEILYAGQDDLTSRDTVNNFVEKFNCGLTVMENGEHWFHTPEQCKVMASWEEKNL